MLLIRAQMAVAGDHNHNIEPYDFKVNALPTELTGLSNTMLKSYLVCKSSCTILHIITHTGIFIMLKSQREGDRPECIAFTKTSITLFACTVFHLKGNFAISSNNYIATKTLKCIWESFCYILILFLKTENEVIRSLSWFVIANLRKRVFFRVKQKNIQLLYS